MCCPLCSSRAYLYFLMQDTFINSTLTCLGIALQGFDGNENKPLALYRRSDSGRMEFDPTRNGSRRALSVGAGPFKRLSLLKHDA